MIHLTRLNHQPLVLNADLIASIETTPDTVIALTTGEKLVVLEPSSEVVRRVVEFRRAIYHGTGFCPSAAAQRSAAPSEPAESGRSGMEHGTDNPSA